MRTRVIKMNPKLRKANAGVVLMPAEPEVVVEQPKIKKVVPVITVTPTTTTKTVKTLAPTRIRNNGASKAAVKVEKFNTLVGYSLTDRDLTGLRAIKTDYNDGVFHRGNIDVGVLRRLGERGLVQYVGGDTASIDARFRLSPTGLSF